MKFTIRDLLWLTVVVALGIGMWLGWRDRTGLERDNARLRNNLRLADKMIAELAKLPAVKEVLDRAPGL